MNSIMVLTGERPPPEPSPPPPEPSPPSSEVLDPQALIEEARRRQRRRYRRAGVCLLALAVLAATVVVGVDHRRGRPVSPTTQRADRPVAAVPATPKEIVAWMSDDRVVVLSSATGRILRTLAAPVLLDEPGLPDLTVSPTGMVYFDSASLSSFNTGIWGGADQIFEVPLAGGPVTHLAAGYDPQVSPDGRLLAFLAPEAGGQAPYLDPAGGIAIAHISPGGLTATHVLHPDARQLNQGLSQLSWSSDSRRLSFAQLDGDTDVTTFWTVPVDAAETSLAAASRVPLGNPSLTWNGYWGSHRVDGRAVGLGVLTTADGTQRVVVLDPRTGRQLSTLFSIPGEVCVALGPTSPPMTAPRPSPCAYGFDNTVISDTSGGDVLLGGTTSLNTSGGAGTAPALYRWRMGTPRLIRLTPGVLLATWGPR